MNTAMWPLEEVAERKTPQTRFANLDASKAAAFCTNHSKKT
jgi:hypothetical protein